MPAPRRDRLIGKIPLHWALATPFLVLTTGGLSWVGLQSSPFSGFMIVATTGMALMLAYWIANSIRWQNRAHQATTEHLKIQNLLNRVNAAITSMQVFPDGHWYIDRVSAGVELISGYTPQELTLDNFLWINQIHPEDWHGMEANVFADIAAERSSTYEYRFKHKDGSLRWISQSNNSVWNETEQCWTVTVVSVDISDRKQTEIALANSEAQRHNTEKLLQQHSLISPTNVFVLVQDPDGHVWFEFTSAAVESIHEFTVEQIMQDASLALGSMHPDDQAGYHAAVLESLQTLSPFSYEWRIITPSGKLKWLQVNSRPEHRENGAIAWYGAATDITDRKAAEARLRQSEANLKKAQELAHLGNWEFDLATGEVSWSEEMYRIHGLSPQCDGAIGAGTLQHIHPGDREKYQQVVLEPSERGEGFATDFRIITTQGETRFIEAIGQPILDDQHQITGFCGTVQDITDRKHLEYELEQSKAQLQNVLDSSIAAIGTAYVQRDHAWEFGFLSSGHEQLYGYSPAELKADPTLWWSRIHPDDLQTVILPQFAAIEQERPVNYEYRFQHRDGQWRWISANQSSEWRHDLQGWLVTSVSSDISDRKQAEAALQDSEDTNRALLRSVPDLIIHMDRQGNYLQMLNPGNIDLLTPTLSRSGKNLREIVPVPFAEQRLHYINLALQTQTTQIYEYQLDNQGNIQYEEARITPCTEETVLIIVRDISDRKRAEIALKQALQELTYHVEHSPLATIRWNRELRVERWSKQAELIFGWKAEEVLGKNMHEWRFICEDDFDSVNQATQQLLNGTATLCLNRNYHKDGSVVYSEWYNSVLLDEHGELVSILSLMQDVTQRTQTELALRQSEARFQQLGAASPGVIYAIMESVSGPVRFEYVSAAFEEIHEVPVAQALQDASIIAQQMHPDDRAGYQQAIVQSLATMEPFWYEWRITTPSGKMKWLQANSRPERLPNGDVMWQGIVLDVSDRKRAEIALANSEAQNRAILSAIPDIITLYSREGIYLSAMQPNRLNDVIDDPDPIGKHFYELLPVEVADRQIAAIQRLTETQEPQIYEQEIWVRGRLQYEEVRLVACGDNAILVIVRDISDRKLREIEQHRAEEALRESEERFRRAFDDAAIGMAWVGIDGRFLKVSQSLTDIVGYDETELLARRFHDLTHPDDLALDLEFSQRMLAGEQRAYQREKRYFHKQGHLIWVLVNVSLVRDRAGHPLYFVSQIQDISDRHELDRIKDEFISIVSHELRTPLTAIRGSLGILETGILDDEPDTAKHMLQVALNNSDRLVRLVNDILDLERLDSGTFNLVIEPCAVADLLQQAVESVQAIALQEHITIHVTAIDATLEAAPDAIVQAMVNLLGNAIKFSPPHSTIWLKAELAPSSPPSLLFSIQDQGRGIPPEKLEPIFGRFQQVDVSDSRQKGGTGLGLAICKSIVQQHRGTIWAESELGTGSTFYFTIPLKQSHD